MASSRSDKQLRATLHILFLVSGTATVLIGQVLPVVSRNFALNDLQSGYLFPTQFAGSLAGTFLTSRLSRVGRFRTASWLGAASMAAGVLLLNVNYFPLCLAGFFVNGLGVGLTLPAINMLVLELNPTRPGAALSLLNFCWGVGAIICKPFVDATVRGTSISLTTIILSVSLVIPGILLFRGSDPRRDVAAEGENLADASPIWTLPLAWLIALFNFVHVGFESGIGGWLTTYTERVEHGSFTHWLSPTLIYFTMFVAGRGIAPLLFRVLNENRMLFLGLGTVFIGMLVLLWAGSVVTLGTGAAICGFGTSWIFPTNVARFTATFGPTSSRRATPLFVCGTLGAACSTWLIGFVSERSGSLRSGMFVLGISILLLLALQTLLALRAAKPLTENA